MRCKSLLIAFVLIASSLPVWAQRGAKQNTYKSPRGYSIVIPTGWKQTRKRVELTGELKKRAEEAGIDPENMPREERFHAEKIDGEFQDNMGIQVERPGVLTDEAVKELHSYLVPNYQRMFNDFKLMKFERRTFGSNDAIHIVGSYRLQGFDVVMDQAMIMSSKGSLIITCSMGRARQLDVRKSCEESFATARFHEPATQR